jgi:hypothetical protein
MPIKRLATTTALMTLLLSTVHATPIHAASPEEIEAKLKALEEQVGALRRELQDARKPAPPSAPAPATAPQPPPTTGGTASQAPQPTQETAPPYVARPSLLSDFKIGGYGSTRFEASDLKNLNNTFTFRRFVLSGDAAIGDVLRAVVELEFERLTELEIERKRVSEGGAQGFSQAIEGSDQSELSLEQAWVQFALADWAKFRAGMLLVPLGRFNLNHDDNRWDLPRRSLVDRGVPVLPSTAAWSEVGMGFVGDIPVPVGTLSYQAYVMNGVTLDSSIETFARGSGELEAEVEIQPRRGTANIDVKRDKAGALRLAWSPALGHEVAASAYYGRYTPDFLPSEAVWSWSVDGKSTFGPFEIEGEYVFTHWDNIRRVANGFARAVIDKSFESGTAPLNSTIEFELAGLATTKHGYWVDLRYRFFPDFLRGTVLGRPFENPQFIATLRGEQVWLNGLVQDVDFAGGVLGDITRDNRFVNRVTLGLAYRPMPLVVFQAALERTWTDRNKSLAAVTNFLPAQRTEDTANSFLFGVAFGF